MDEVTDSDSPAAVLPGFDFPRLIDRSRSGIKEEECRLERGAVCTGTDANSARCALNMLEKVLNMLSFGCRHAHLSVPFSMDVARQAPGTPGLDGGASARLLALRRVPGLRTALRL